MTIRAALFDFDGTLADSFAAIGASTNHVRRAYGLPALAEADVRQYVGFGLHHLMAELVPGADPDEAVQRYREHHPSVMFTHTKLMPGVAEVIPELHRRGIRLAVCSNKQVHFTKQLVEALGFLDVMREVLGPDDVNGQPKPDPAMVIACLERMSVPREEAVYVGDMAIDVRTAKAAGIPCWLVPGGAAGQESAASAGPDRILRDFTEILELLPQL